MGAVLSGMWRSQGRGNQAVQREVVIRSDGCWLREVSEILTCRSQ